MDVKAHCSQDLEDLRQRIRTERNAKQRDRYRAVQLALTGQTTETIRHTLDRSKNFVQRWVYAYRDGGVEAIQPRRHTGRPSKLTAQEEHQLRERILAGPQRRDAVCSLRGEDARRILREEFGVSYSLPGVYALLHRLGLSCLAPRPRHTKNDPEAMRQWLQDAPLLSTACETKDRTSG
jgi:putative transposase